MIGDRPPLRKLTATGTVIACLSAAVSATNALTLPTVRRDITASTTEAVVVCIPARDEEENLPDLLRDLRAQSSCPNMRVIVVDDGSSDATAAVARQAVASDPRFSIVEQQCEPPPGWTGKAAACVTLADLAFDEHVDLIAFVDADVRLEPDAIAAAAVALRSHDAALLCPWPIHTTGSLAESLVQPLLSFSWMSTLLVRAANSSYRPSTVVSCGQFMMFDAVAYRSIGGHAAVSGSPTEDLDIARVLRRHRNKTVLVSAAGSAECRMYSGWTEVRSGYTRWLWSAFGGPAGSRAVLGIVTLAYLLPPVATLFGSGATRRWGLLGTLAAVLARLAAQRAEVGRRQPVLHSVCLAVAQPVSAAIYAGLTIDSLRRRRRGQLSWKNRALPYHNGNSA